MILLTYFFASYTGVFCTVIAGLGDVLAAYRPEVKSDDLCPPVYAQVCIKQPPSRLISLT